MIVFPLCNAVFDFLSFGVTRLCLYAATTDPPLGFLPQNRVARHAVCWVIDLVVATLCLIALALTIVTFVRVINLAALAGPTGAELIPLADKFTALTNPVETPTWVYVMHLSTFLPSAVHFVLMLMALPFSVVGDERNQALAAHITPALVNNGKLHNWVAFRHSLRWSGSVIFVIGAGWVLFTWGASADAVGYLGRWMLALIEGYAGWIGAI